MTSTGRSVNSRITYLLSAILIALLIPFCIFASPLSMNGQLRVSGNNLVNECGTQVQLRGVSSHGLQWYGLIQCMDYCCVSASALDYLANNVGIDVFRIAVYPEPNGYISNPSGFTNQANNIVQMCEDRGIYAIIDWHTLTPGDPNSSIVYARTFWESMATANKDRKNVIYEICNEPNGVSWTQIRTYANDIIPRIRAIDPDAIIIVGTPNWSQLGSEVVSNQLSYSNIMYTFHFYAATHDTSMLTNYIGQLPIFVTEWAATEATGSGATNYTRADSFINIMATNKISWAAWSWSEAPETSGMLNAGACDSASWSSYKPTGSYVVGKISNPADSFVQCNFPTPTRTPTVGGPVVTETVPPTDLRLDSMADGNYISNICTNWYSYDDSNDCTDKNCTINPHGNSYIVPWSKDHWQDLGRPIQPFYMQSPGRTGAGDYAARITGYVTTTFLYGFAGLGFPLKEPEGPVNISAATGISFWCKSNETRTYRLKINAPQAFGGRLDEDMYGYVFTANTSWQKVSIDFSSILFSQEGWGNTLVTRTMALSAVDTIQWQTQGQTGAPYNFDLWVDDVILINAPAALKTIAAGGCVPTNTFTRTPTWDPAIPTYTHTPTPAYAMRVNAGGTADYTDGAGKVWYLDQPFTPGSWGFEGGGGVAANPGVPVGNTVDDTLYQSERWGNPTYRFTVPNGSYQVTLRFAEMYFTATNARVFDVVVEGVLAVDNLDLVAAAGAKNAYDVTVTVTVNDGQLTITSSATVDGALINAIQVIGVPPPVNTPTRTPAITSTRTPTRTVTSTSSRTATPQSSATNTAASTFTYTRTATPTATRTATPLPSATNTAASTFTFTRTPTSTRTVTTGPSATNTTAITMTFTGTAVLTFTRTVTPLPSATNTAVNTFTATRTATGTATRTNTALPTNTNTDVNTQTYTRTATPTATLTGTRTNTPYYSPTSTATRTYTATPTFTRTATATHTVTMSNTVSPTISQTWTGTPPTSTNTSTITRTWTNSRTYTATTTDTATFTNTVTLTPTITYTLVSTATLTSTHTPVNTVTVTGTDTPVNTITETNTPVNTPTEFPSGMPTFTATDVSTNTPTALPTDTPVDTQIPTSTAVNTTLPTGTPVNTAVWTAVATLANTFTRTVTRTATPANTFTATAAATLTATDVSTVIPTATPTSVFTITPTRTPAPADADSFEITDDTAYPNPYNPSLGLPLRIIADFSQGHRNTKVIVYTSALRRIREITCTDSLWAGPRTLVIPASSFDRIANGAFYYVITAENNNGTEARSSISGLIILK